MPKYINVELAKKETQCFIPFTQEWGSTTDVCDFLDTMPEEDVAPVIRAIWLGGWECSHCNCRLDSIMDTDGYFAIGFNGTDYCPFC